jgi:hypothetical protein
VPFVSPVSLGMGRRPGYAVQKAGTSVGCTRGDRTGVWSQERVTEPEVRRPALSAQAACIRLTERVPGHVGARAGRARDTVGRARRVVCRGAGAFI